MPFERSPPGPPIDFLESNVFRSISNQYYEQYRHHLPAFGVRRERRDVARVTEQLDQPMIVVAPSEPWLDLPRGLLERDR